MASSDISHTAELTGLGTFTIMAVPNTDQYAVKGKLSLPTIPSGASDDSQVVVVIKQNGSTIYTGQPGAKGFKVIANCVAGDIISMVLSSSNAVDQVLNAVRSTVSIAEGVS